MLYYTSCELKLSLAPIKLAETLASLSTHMFYVVLVCVFISVKTSTTDLQMRKKSWQFFLNLQDFIEIDCSNYQ